ncbi:hypothetical protein RhiLY_11625 [Ceratobasidium sp. AG-Ba]|nr:hypothetical protein RhiLY_11625 [Ceratobasidium sp. AG-Ba]
MFSSSRHAQDGYADGFNTETPEHCHIKSKQAWRASNKVAPTPQMIRFIQRYEALRILRARINAYIGIVESDGGSSRKSCVVYDDDDALFCPTGNVAGGQGAGRRLGAGGDEGSGAVVDIGAGLEEDDQEDNQEEGEDEEQTHIPGRMRTAADARRHVVYPNPTLSIALKPTSGRVRGLDIIANHGATDFVSALHAFLNTHGSRKLPPFFLPTPTTSTLSGTDSIFDTTHYLSIPNGHVAMSFALVRQAETRRACLTWLWPWCTPSNLDFIVSFIFFSFPLVQLLLDVLNSTRTAGYQAVRVRAIFGLPRTFEDLYPHPLVYVELFTHFSHSISPYHAMHSLSHARF